MKIKFATILTTLLSLLIFTQAVPVAGRALSLDEAARPQADTNSVATVDVAHFAPFADANTPDSTSVTVRVNGGNALTSFKFGDIAEDIELAAGNYLIEILPGGVEPVAISGNVSLVAGKSYTLAAIGDGTNQTLELLALEQDTTPDASNAKLFVAHLAPFANTLAGTAVDICTDSGSAVLADFRYKEYTDPYVTLPPDDYDLQIRVANATACTGALALDIPSIRLAAGDIVDVFAIGLAKNWPLSVASTTGFTPTLLAETAGEVSRESCSRVKRSAG